MKNPMFKKRLVCAWHCSLLYPKQTWPQSGESYSFGASEAHRRQNITCDKCFAQCKHEIRGRYLTSVQRSPFVLGQLSK